MWFPAIVILTLQNRCRWWRNESHFFILGPEGGGSKSQGIWTSKIFFMVWNTWPAFIQETFWHLRQNGGTPEHRGRLSVTLLSVLWTTGCSWFLSSVLKVVTYHEKCVKLNFPELVLLAPLHHSWEFMSSYLDVILTLKLFKSSWIQNFSIFLWIPSVVEVKVPCVTHEAMMS